MFLLLSKSELEHQGAELTHIHKKNKAIFLQLLLLIYLIFEWGIVISALFFAVYENETGRLTLRYFIKIFSSDFNAQFPVIKSILNSFLLAGVSATCGIIFSYFLLTKASKNMQLIIPAITGISQAFMALALYYFHSISGISMTILFVAGIIIFIVPLGYNFLYAPLRQIDKSIIEAAKTDGASSIVVFLKFIFL